MPSPDRLLHVFYNNGPVSLEFDRLNIGMHVSGTGGDHMISGAMTAHGIIEHSQRMALGRDHDGFLFAVFDSHSLHAVDQDGQIYSAAQKLLASAQNQLSLTRGLRSNRIRRCCSRRGNAQILAAAGAKYRIIRHLGATISTKHTFSP